MRRLLSIVCITLLTSITSFGGIVFAVGNFELPLSESIEIGDTANHVGVGIAERLVNIQINPNNLSGEGIRDFIVGITVQILIPILVFAGIIVAIIGFYRLMNATDEEAQKKAFNYLLRGTVGVVIMVSAGFIVSQLVGTDGGGGIIGSIGAGDNDRPAGAVIAEEIYVNIVFPLLRIFIYFALGILFIMAIVHAFEYIFTKDDEFQRKSFTILIYNALGIIVIILAKEMIEIVYGKYSEVIDANVIAGSGSDLGDIGSGVLEVREFGGLQTAINRVLSIATFIVLVLIIYQAYQLLTNPSSEELVENLRKNIVYTFIGILIIGAGYLLTNFFIIT